MPTNSAKMELSTILSISGKPGLYKIISQSRGGVVVSSLLDGKKVSIGQTQRVSTLSDISIYTEEGDEPLENIFKKFHARSEGGVLEIDKGSNDDLRNFFLEILPDHDESRVYASDIKKMVKWFNLLMKNGLVSFDEENAASDAEPSVETTGAEVEAKVEEAPETEDSEKAEETSK